MSNYIHRIWIENYTMPDVCNATVEANRQLLKETEIYKTADDGLKSLIDEYLAHDAIAGAYYYREGKVYKHVSPDGTQLLCQAVFPPAVWNHERPDPTLDEEYHGFLRATIYCDLFGVVEYAISDVIPEEEPEPQSFGSFETGYAELLRIIQKWNAPPLPF
jgi:hypothetical protein